MDENVFYFKYFWVIKEYDEKYGWMYVDNLKDPNRHFYIFSTREFARKALKELKQRDPSAKFSIFKRTTYAL